MIRIPGQPGRDLCDPHLGITRRDLIRVGGSALMGLTLGSVFSLQGRARAALGAGKGPVGWGKAKSVVMVYLQGGPSHLDLWDPKENLPDKMSSPFKRIKTKIPGVNFTELLPKLAGINDKFSMIRSMGYTPNGLFNHTAAIYQLMTGYTTDKVSPSGQLEPPNAKDFPNFGSNIIRLKPPTDPVLPFVQLPRPLQESNVIGKGGGAGFLGKAFDPYTLFPEGDDLDMTKMNRVKVDDLKLRPDVFAQRLERRARLRDAIEDSMPEIDKAVAQYNLDEYYDKALTLIVSGKAREAFEMDRESEQMRERYGMNTFGQSLLLARRLVEAGTRVVEVIWPKVANSDNHSWDMHTGLTTRIKDQAAPMLDKGFTAFIEDMEARGLLDETIIVALGEFGRSPEKGVSTSGNINSSDGRDHWPYCYTAMVAGAGTKRGYVHGESDATGSSPKSDPVHPCELLATIYNSVGIDPETIVYNHLNQPRELVKAKPVSALYA
ncbi:MAG: DUF1501 domain-containing protein [Chthoniobacteraceae bacterium]